jgi:hypothetical protein
MPSLKTAFRYLINMGTLGLVINPILFGFYFLNFGEYLDGLTKLILVTVFGFSYFGQMCGLVVLRHLEIQSQGGSLHTAQTPVVSKEEEAEEKKRLKKQGWILQVIFVVIVLIAIKIANS